jgi:alkylated DNA repair dioxygenase AlkB
VVDLPTGLIYEPALLTHDEERRLLDRLADIDFAEIRMHGVVAKRTAKHYGFDYDFEQRRAIPDAEPIPDWLEPPRARAAELAGSSPDALVEVLVLRYPEGAQIGWHRDAPMFGTVVGISLLSPSRMRFRRGRPGAWETAEVTLEPRSGYVLAGDARTKWQHHVPPTKSERYSITFRTLRKPKPVSSAA